MCWTTPQGWMLIKSASTAQLWNPCTGVKLPLPDIGDEHGDIPRHCKCLLTHKDPTHPSCVVVLFPITTPDMWYCHVNLLETNRGSWTHCSYDIGNYELPEEYRPPTKRVISSIASLQGKLYFINSARDMCTINFSDSNPEFDYFDVRMVSFPKGMCSGTVWLVESDSELFLTRVCFVGFDPNDIGAIQVYKMDFGAHAWVRVDDIGDRVFLLENTNMAASCPASPLGLKGNQVYFMRNILVDDADLCIFDLESETQDITKVHQHDDLLICRKPFWIVPPS
ncbi:hypothetical protein ACP70R_020297 [Stipagrostis hirtigluma subsp. patula]